MYNTHRGFGVCDPVFWLLDFLCLWVVTSTTARKLGCSTGIVTMLLLTRTGITGLAYLF